MTYLSELRIAEEIIEHFFFLVKQLWITKNNFSISYYTSYLHKQVQEIISEFYTLDTNNFSGPF